MSVSVSVDERAYGKVSTCRDEIAVQGPTSTSVRRFVLCISVLLVHIHRTSSVTISTDIAKCTCFTL